MKPYTRFIKMTVGRCGWCCVADHDEVLLVFEYVAAVTNHIGPITMPVCSHCIPAFMTAHEEELKRSLMNS